MSKPLLFIPGPVTRAPEVLDAMAKPMIDHRGPEFAALLERIAEGMKPIFGTTDDVLVLGSSGTGEEVEKKKRVLGRLVAGRILLGPNLSWRHH